MTQVFILFLWMILFNNVNYNFVVLSVVMIKLKGFLNYFCKTHVLCFLCVCILYQAVLRKCSNCFTLIVVCYIYNWEIIFIYVDLNKQQNKHHKCDQNTTKYFFSFFLAKTNPLSYRELSSISWQMSCR